ncbi:unnamed protein product [Coregonus sp. 'balchen']|nr:unnamed protein product [Coregonus sp. 'balchen']
MENHGTDWVTLIAGSRSIMEQFNPCLRNFVAMGKSYEKALSSVTFAAKGYFEALVRMGEMASESQGSKDLVAVFPYPPLWRMHARTFGAMAVLIKAL